MSNTNFDASLIARCIITYESTHKLDPKDAKNLEDLEQATGSPKTSFKAKMRKIKKISENNDKENLNYLEEVERNIMNRRRKGENSSEKGPGSQRLLRSSSKLKGILSRHPSNKNNQRVPLGATSDPELFYKTAGDHAKPNEDVLKARMATELAKSRQELKELREKLKKMEEGQMTVDNIQLAKQLDEEKNQLNSQRLELLKEFAKDREELDKEKKAFDIGKSKLEEDSIKNKSDLDEKIKQFELDKLQYKALDDDMKNRRNQLDLREEKVKENEGIIDKKLGEILQTEKDLSEYQIELNEMKDKLLQERERLINEKSKANAEKDELERDIKSLKNVKENLQKEKDKEMKDIMKKKKDLDSQEEKLNRDLEKQLIDEERLERDKGKIDDELRRQKLLTEELEEEKLKLWRDRNTLNNEIKQFIDDKKKMENELKWRNKEMEQVDEEIRKDLEELERDREALDEYEQKLEDMKEDIETRERMLLHDREDFNNLKLKFIDGLMQSGGLAHLTPELKQMAKNMGIDVDQMEEEKNRLDARRKELEKLQKQHEDELSVIKAKVNSRGGSRRSSVSGTRRGSIMPGKIGLPKLGGNNKMTAESFLFDLYEEASNKFTLKELKENKEKLAKLEEEKVFSTNMIEQLRNDNKAIKKDYDILSKIIEQYRGDGLKVDLNALFGKIAPKEVGTSTDDDLGFDDEKYLLQDKIRELEGKIKRGGSVAGAALSDMEDDDFNARLREIQEQLKK